VDTSTSFLHRLSTIVAILCVSILGGTVLLIARPDLRQFVGLGPAAVPPAYVAGDRVDVDPEVFSDAPTTLLVFARSTCAACQSSADFHAQVVALARQAGHAAVLLTPSDDGDAEAAYGERLGVGRGQVHHFAPGSIKLRAVPTLMLVDTTGLIHHVWFGIADDPTKAAILQAVSPRT
jgi:hypothetical protein